MVAHEIVRDITTGDLQRWTAIPHEADLIERYGVGRASLREALQVLEVLEVISLSRGPRGGPTVLAPGCGGFARMTSLFLQLQRVRLAEVVDSWMTLEHEVVRMAALRHGSAQLSELAAQVAGVAVEEDAVFVATVRGLSHAVTRAAGNPLLELMVDSLEQIVVDRLGRFLVPVDQRAAWMCGAGDLLSAVLRGRPEEADEHLGDLLGRLRRHLDPRSALLAHPVLWG